MYLEIHGMPLDNNATVRSTKSIPCKMFHDSRSFIRSPTITLQTADLIATEEGLQGGDEHV
jgi:hypothetical protein